MICKVCRKELYGSEKEFNNGMCWYCEEAYNDPDPYADNGLNEVDMGRFDDDPPEYMQHWERQFNWLESWPVTPVVAGSSPVRSAT